MPVVEKIHKRDFPLPDLNDPSYFVQGALLSEDKLKGAFFARLTSELILILDENLPNFTRAMLFREASQELLKELLSRGVKSTHLFLTPEDDRKHMMVLMKHFGFVEATGRAMYWEVK